MSNFRWQVVKVEHGKIIPIQNPVFVTLGRKSTVYLPPQPGFHAVRDDGYKITEPERYYNNPQCGLVMKLDKDFVNYDIDVKDVPWALKARPNWILTDHSVGITGLRPGHIPTKIQLVSPDVKLPYNMLQTSINPVLDSNGKTVAAICRFSDLIGLLEYLYTVAKSLNLPLSDYMPKGIDANWGAGVPDCLKKYVGSKLQPWVAPFDMYQIYQFSIGNAAIAVHVHSSGNIAIQGKCRLFSGTVFHPIFQNGQAFPIDATARFISELHQNNVSVL